MTVNPLSSQRILVIGAGRGGTAMLELFLDDPSLEIVGIMDANPQAPALTIAKKHGIKTFTNLAEAIKASFPCIVFNLTNDNSVTTYAEAQLGDANVIGGFQATFLWKTLTRFNQAEEGLRIAAIAFESQESLFITDVQGVILQVNQAFIKNTGYTANEAVGQTPRLLKSGRHDAEFYRMMWETIKQTGSWKGAVQDKHKNGEINTKLLSITSVKDTNGVTTHYVGSSIDITERKKFELSLRESEERLKLALASANEGTWDLEPPTGRLNFDSPWGVILGYANEEERPHYLEDWANMIHARDRERVLKAMHDHIAGTTSEYREEYRIRSHSGEWKWVVGHGKAVQRGLDGKALRIVGVTRDITLSKQAAERIWQLAHFDSLTGLPNRPLFYDRLSQSVATARRHNKKLALLFLDLDGFKQVNDEFGHDTGDRLLQEVAERLSQHIRGEDTVARTGGDEFIFILNDISHAGNAAIVANKIILSLSEPFVIYENTCLIGGSIGISIFPDDSDEMETLVTQSDKAMYKAKEQGKNNYHFFAAP